MIEPLSASRTVGHIGLALSSHDAGIVCSLSTAAHVHECSATCSPRSLIRHTSACLVNQEPSSIRRRQMMKLLVALLLATSAEGLNTKQQVALKKPLVLRGGALGAKTALLVQTAGLTAFGSEFILSKWASTRYWVCARHCTRKPHNCRVTCLRAQCRGLALTRCIDCSLPTLALRIDS